VALKSLRPCPVSHPHAAPFSGIASTTAQGTESIPYRVTVTNGPDQAIVSVHAGARGQGRERVVVRL
jgi:hypothetical protein